MLRSFVSYLRKYGKYGKCICTIFFRFLFLFLAPALSTYAATPRSQSIVLVHGAFADGSSWSQVIPLLQHKGFHVSTVQLPLTSLADDVTATRRVIERQPGDVILVAHSWAGVVVTEAANSPAVKGIVYLSAMVPDNAESAAGMLQRLNSPMEGMQPDANGFIWLNDAKAFRNIMAGDLPEATTQLLAVVGKPIAARSFTDLVTHAAWHNKPTWYLITEDDRALPPTVQHKLASQINAQTLTLKSSHFSLWSYPRQVTDFIESAASNLDK